MFFLALTSRINSYIFIAFSSLEGKLLLFFFKIILNAESEEALFNKRCLF